MERTSAACGGNRDAMNPIHLHLVTTHAPLWGMLFGAALLVWALARRSDELKRTGLGLVLLAALLVAPAFSSGEPAEKALGSAANLSRTVIDRHAEVAQLALGVSVLAGTAALGGLFAFRGRTLPRWYVLGVAGLALMGGGLLGWTANLGGQIRHTEMSPSPP